MGEIIKFPDKFPETMGDYLMILVGEGEDEDPVVCIEQCLTHGKKTHVNAVFLEVEQLDVLIRELTLVSSMFKEKH
jgi:hypothetical protein